MKKNTALNFKPLLLLIPLLAIFGLALVLDQPLAKEDGAGTAAASSVNSGSAAAGSGTQTASSEAAKAGEPGAAGSAAGTASGAPRASSQAAGETSDGQSAGAQSAAGQSALTQQEETLPAWRSAYDSDPADWPSETLELIVGQAGSLEDDIGEPVRDLPDEEAEDLGDLQFNCCVLKAEEQPADENWIAVELQEGQIGYVRAKNVEERTVTITDPEEMRVQICKDALQYLGLRFDRYGKSLTEGIDCSNFVNQIYGMHDLTVPDTCKGIIAEGEKIKKKEARAGDVIFYNVNKGYGHVGIFLGNGCLINSTGHAGKVYPEGGVRICRLIYRDREKYSVYNVIDHLGKKTGTAETEN